jgi:hypothetical protein
VSERHLRPSVIFRKVTNGFRCEWSAETYAAFRSIVSTAKSHPFQGDAVSPTLTDDGSINEVWLGMASCSGSI